MACGCCRRRALKARRRPPKSNSVESFTLFSLFKSRRWSRSTHVDRVDLQPATVPRCRARCVRHVALQSPGTSISKLDLPFPDPIRGLSSQKQWKTTFRSTRLLSASCGATCGTILQSYVDHPSRYDIAHANCAAMAL